MDNNKPSFFTKPQIVIREKTCNQCSPSGIRYVRKKTDGSAYAFKCDCEWGRRCKSPIPEWDSSLADSYF